MAERHLNPAEYGDYKQTIEFTIGGAHVKWSSVPVHEMTRIRPLIREQIAVLGELYDVSSEVRRDYVYLDVRFREHPTPAQVRNLKGEVFALVLVTSWGGP